MKIVLKFPPAKADRIRTAFEQFRFMMPMPGPPVDPPPPVEPIDELIARRAAEWILQQVEEFEYRTDVQTVQRKKDITAEWKDPTP